MNSRSKSVITRILVSVTLVTSALVAHAETPAGPQTVEEMAKLIATRPFTVAMSLAPDGKHFALVVQKGEQQTLKIVNATSGATTHEVDFEKSWRFGRLFWANEERILVQPQFKPGNTNRPVPTAAIFASNIDGSKDRFLLGINAGARTGALSGRTNKRMLGLVRNTYSDDRRKVLVDLFDPASKRPSVGLLDVYTGKISKRSYGPNVQFCTFALDEDLNATYCTTVDSVETDQPHIYHRPSGSKEWTMIYKGEWDESGAVAVHGQLNDDSYLATFPHPETSVTSFYSIAVENGELKRTLLHTDPTFDPLPSQAQFRANRNMFMATYANPKPSYVYFGQDENLEALHQSITAAFPDKYVSFRGITEDEKLAMVSVSSDEHPRRLYLLDVDSKQMQLVDNAFAEREVMAVPMEPVKFEARDGKPLHGLLSLANNRPAKGTVMYLHGGPHGPFDIWGSNREVHFFTSLGFNVLQVNFRGSGGYGMDFQRAGYREWGRKMQTDVTDATKWAIDNGYATEGKICIYGGSYGAYTSLAGAAFEPGLYSCAVGHVGVYDLNMMRKAGDIPDFKAGIRYLDRVIGRDEEDLKSRSPAEFAHNIKIPVLLTAGLDDDRTPPIQTRIMARALKEAGNEPIVSYQAREGHGFFSEEAETKRLIQLGNFMLSALGGAE